MIEAGAERLGTSAGVAIVEEYNNQNKKGRWFYMKDEVKVLSDWFGSCRYDTWA